MNKSSDKTRPPNVRWLIAGGALLLYALALYACAPAATPEPTLVPPVPTATPLPDQSAYVAELESSMHGYYGDDLYHGPNTWCARCHSPQNWDPAAVPGKAPNCSP